VADDTVTATFVNAIAQGAASVVIAVGMAAGKVDPIIGGPILLSALGCGAVAARAIRNGKDQ